MTTEERLRTAGRCARVNPGPENVLKHFVRAVHDGHGTYRYVFHLYGMTYLVLKESSKPAPYASVKIWQTGCIENTYATWKTRVPIELSDDQIIDAYARAVDVVFETAAFIVEDVSNAI